ncbi:MAG: NADH-dependent [FeFe] hydrogenase, group A6 [Clostridia bacterium]|nr:NADH-dependent [FeFe] hydrogenase, group A6 [Clostridia bacterium]
MDKVNVTINGNTISVPADYTILEAARSAGIDIPTLCYLKDVSQTGSCRMCLVEVQGARALQAACVYPVNEGLVVNTNTKAAREARRTTLELILSNHDRKCLTCVRNQNCELQKLCDELGVEDIPYEGVRIEHETDATSPSIVRDDNKCVLCRRCVNMCKNIQTVGAIETVERGFDTSVGCAFGMDLADTSCVNCGQCIAVCPVGALYEQDATKTVWAALENPDLHVVVQPAPAVRVALGEEFGLPIGTRVTGKMAAALRRLGFDKVFDTDFAADLTIMEEGTELLGRIKNGGKLPMITSCSPGWIKFCEHNFPDFLDNLSTCKSPHEMYGAVIKSYYASVSGIDPKNIFTVSVMPCTAKKFEAQRDELAATGYQDVDVVLTTRELAKMIKQSGIDFNALPDEGFDDPFGAAASGAGVIFGATGGVMEAAIRTVAEILEGKEIPDIEYTSVRGVEGIKVAQVEAGGKTIRAAVAHGLGNARALLERIRSGEIELDFIEIMACPGGCVNGGGQPIVPAKVKMSADVRAVRAAAIYDEDESLEIRKSHENPYIKKLYDEYLGEPCGHKSHELLHTHYVKRNLFTK